MLKGWDFYIEKYSKELKMSSANSLMELIISGGPLTAFLNELGKKGAEILLNKLFSRKIDELDNIEDEIQEIEG